MLLGIDIGGTKCAIILGKIESGDEIKIIDKTVTPTDKPVFEMIEYLFDEADALLKKSNVSTNDISGIGISCGGPLNSKTGTILSPPNLPGWDNIPIAQITEERFNIKTYLQNDANAGAVAEWKYGAGKGYNNLIFLTFGTGNGAGLILNGKLYSGTNDLAGESGHIRLAEIGPVGFGKAGSFEGFCSGGGIAQLAQIKVREKLQMGKTVSFCKSIEELNNITAKTVAEAAFKGDALAVEIYNICGFYLGRGLSVLIDVLNPEMILLGGIYGRAKGLLETSMHKVIEEEALSLSYKNCKIMPAQLGEKIGDMAALSLASMISQH
jgi:glucokinase